MGSAHLLPGRGSSVYARLLLRASGTSEPGEHIDAFALRIGPVRANATAHLGSLGATHLRLQDRWPAGLPLPGQLSSEQRQLHFPPILSNYYYVVDCIESKRSFATALSLAIRPGSGSLSQAMLRTRIKNGSGRERSMAWAGF